MELGTYCFLYDKYKECVDVNTDKNDIIEVERSVNIVIKLDKGSVLLTNVDSDGDDIYGSVVELYSDDDKLLYTGLISEDSKFKVDNLVVGEYCFKQKSAPDGYLINRDKVCFEIINDKEVQVKLVNNKKIVKSIFIPNTFSNIGDYYKLAFILIISIMGVICYGCKGS